jgi:urease accessory protein
VLALSRSDSESVETLRRWVLGVLASHRAGTHIPQDPGPMAPHFHAEEDAHDHAHDHDHVHVGDHTHH